MPSATTSDFQHGLYMDKFFYGTQWNAYTNLYIALFVSVPPLSGPVGGEEVVISVGTNYSRVAVAVGAGEWNDDGAGEYRNTNQIIFPLPGDTDWNIITGAGIFDAQTAGNMLYYAGLTASKTVSSGDGQPKILENQLRITRASC